LKYIFDVETDGFLNVVSKIHCIVLKDIDANKMVHLSVKEAISELENAELIVGHNIIKYDIPVLKKLYGFNFKNKILDTLVATRLLFPDIKEKDFQRKDFPRDCIGRHSLKAWGNRIGNYKAQFETDWKTFSPAMLDYCTQDVEVTYNLHKMIEEKGYSKQAMDLEHAVAKLIYKQESYGFNFDTDKAKQLYSKLQSRRLELEDELQLLFPPKTLKTPFIPKVNNKARGYIKGKLFYKEKIVVFNPSSRHHIADRLTDIHKWKPTVFNDDGKPKLDETILASLPYPEAKTLCEHFLLDKRIGQLATGAQAWLKHEKNNKIHGTCNTNSTVTARATHSYPNMAQIPSVSVQYGKDCRALFKVPAGKKLVGVDVSGLEVRMLAHYMARYDKGDYSKVVLEGDIHTETQTLAGLDSRDLAKRYFYCFLYGGGVKKIASVINKSVAEASKIKKRFLNNLPALNKLIVDVQLAAERGYLTGLDKRKIKVRSAHAALNTLLQSSGALVCKQWLVEFDKVVKNIPEAQQVVWVHDEIQIECLEKDAEKIGQFAVKAIEDTGRYFNIRLPLTGEYKIGDNWSETH
jgi:DNA polymerase-1|tara:strand:+ start:7315 stop:9045 length:1731 start_codon:yes stop_codon:yes gene_type:complete